MVLSLTRPGVLRPEESAPALGFESVFQLHFRAVWRTLRSLGVQQAQLDDAAQDVFVVVYKKLATFDGRSLRAWLYAIAVRVASDYRRSAVRREAPLSDHPVDPKPGPARATELNESLRLVHTLLCELDADKRTVFVLGELEQLSAPEIAEALGENLNTVYSRLRAARREFEASLARHRARERWRER